MSTQIFTERQTPEYFKQRLLSKKGQVILSENESQIASEGCCSTSYQIVPIQPIYENYDFLDLKDVKKIDIICNPSSSQVKRYSQYSQEINNKGFKCNQIICQQIDDMTSLIENFQNEKDKIIAILGGDGTIFYAVNAIYRRIKQFQNYGMHNVNNNREDPLMILAGGTDNNFLQNQGLNPSTIIEKIIRKPLSLQCKRIDLWKCNFQDKSGHIQEYVFLQSVGISFISKYQQQLNNNQSCWSFNSKKITALQNCIRENEKEEIQLEVDGVVYPKQQISYQTFMNQQGINKVSPLSQVDDGLIELMQFNALDPNEFKQISDLMQKMSGAQLFHPTVQYFRGKKFKVSFQGDKLLYIDGELFNIKDYFTIEKANIDFYCVL